jgi:hypothetical protein
VTRRTAAASTVLLALLACLAVAVVVWVTWSHWQDRGQVRVKPWDGQWWGPATTQADRAGDAVADQAARSRSALDEAIWGPAGGAEAGGQPSAEAPDPAAKQAPTLWSSGRAPAPPPSTPARAMEAELARAEAAFRLGLDHYRQADPAAGAAPAARLDHLRQAESAFAQADNILTRTLPGYAADADHIPRRLEDWRALQAYNRRLFEAAREAEAAAAGWR